MEKFLSNKNIEKAIRVVPKFRKTDEVNKGYSSKKLKNKTRKLVNFYPQKKGGRLIARKTDFMNEPTFSISKLSFLFISEKLDYYRYFLRNSALVKHKLTSCNHYFFLDLKENESRFVFASCTSIEKLPTFRNNLKIREKAYPPCNFFCLLQMRIFENSVKINMSLWQSKICKELLRIDHRVFRLINSNLKCKFLDLYMSAQSYCDSKKFNLSFILILVLSLVILWINKKEHYLEFLILFASTLAISVIIIYFFKHCFERARPLEVLGNANVNILFERSYENSFPSGHTQLAFAACTFMFIVVRKYFILYTILACEVGFERIYAGNHFPSDVVAGAFLGILLAYVVLFFSEKVKYKINF